MELLEDYRVEIDKIDREITQLLEKRMNVAKAISKYKMENNMQIFHPDREKMVIEKNKGYLENKEYEELVEKYLISYYDPLYMHSIKQYKYNDIIKFEDANDTIKKLMSFHKTAVKGVKQC